MCDAQPAGCDEEATQEAAKARLDHTLSTLHSENLEANGALGDYRRCGHWPTLSTLSDRIRS